VGTVDVNLRPFNNIPNNGKIVVTFPSGFVLSSGGVATAGSYTINGTTYPVASVSGQDVTLTVISEKGALGVIN